MGVKGSWDRGRGKDRTNLPYYKKKREEAKKEYQEYNEKLVFKYDIGLLVTTKHGPNDMVPGQVAIQVVRGDVDGDELHMFRDPGPRYILLGQTEVWREEDITPVSPDMLDEHGFLKSPGFIN